MKLISSENWQKKFASLSIAGRCVEAIIASKSSKEIWMEATKSSSDIVSARVFAVAYGIVLWKTTNIRSDFKLEGGEGERSSYWR
jgi:hypothetical protein